MTGVGNKAKAAILISGRGSNMMALVEAARAPDYPAHIALVVSNRPDAQGLAFARASGVEAIALDHKAFGTREAFDAALDDILRARNIALVACAGFMRVMTPWLTGRWQGRMINIHPSLLPAYKGLHTHDRALADGASTHGCTVHFVTAELDDGEIIAQSAVPVLAGETPETLAARVLIEEHKLYPLALARVARAHAKIS
jgi:phosphoribosylglycinamide formyltransferase 1